MAFCNLCNLFFKVFKSTQTTQNITPTKAILNTMARGRRGNNAPNDDRPAGAVHDLRPQLVLDVNAPEQAYTYYRYLNSLMQHKNGVNYRRDRTFSLVEIRSITPDHIYRWMALKAYGIENPTPEDNPTECRSSSMEYFKKAISYFMESTQAWNNETNSGNPTRSRKINRLIAAVKKKETRGLGKESSTDRAFTLQEFEQIVDLIASHGRADERRRYRAMLVFQLHMIARSDDTAHVKKTTLEQSDQFPHFLLVQMRWSKNVHEERDCPKQILLGAMNTKYCVLLALSIFLEKWLRDGEGRTSQWLFVNGTSNSDDTQRAQNKEANAGKLAFGKYLKAVMQKEAFQRDPKKGNLGTHSIKKLGCTYARRCGCPKDFVDYRARWRQKRMQERYADTQLDWPDVCAASNLCTGGVVLYRAKEGSGITDDWLAREITPGITGSFNESVAAILAKSLVWACFEPSAMDMVPADIRYSVNNKFIDLDSDWDGNPMERLQVAASEVNGTVTLDPLPNEGELLAGAVAGGNATVQNREWNNAIYSKVSSTQVKVTEMQNHQIAKFADQDRRLRRLEGMVRMLSMAPARQRNLGTAAAMGRGQAQPADNPEIGNAPVEPPATLSQCPRTLQMLWMEYQNGIAGSKPAREFTREERGGRNKFKYSRRLIVWTCIERMLNRGYDLNRAIAKIHQVYGNGSVTKIIDKMRPDERRGGHHLLR